MPEQDKPATRTYTLAEFAATAVTADGEPVYTDWELEQIAAAPLEGWNGE